jgi:hypothetical protein
MQEEALQQFLSSVRCDRFIDYLDPIGETADEALARRVRWARMTRNDPAHADEAMFLLQHERDLKQVVTRELDAESTWVEGVSAGQEFGGTHWSRESGETTRYEQAVVTETLIPDDDDDDAFQSGIMRLEDVSSDDPWGEPPPEEEAHLEPDITLDQPTTVASSLLQPRGRVRTASPAMRRNTAPTLSTSLEMPTLPPLDEFEQRRQAAVQADNEATDPSARPTPELARAIAAAAAGDTPAPAPDVAPTDPATPPRTQAQTTRDDERGVPWGIIGAVVGLLAAGGLALAFVAPGPAEDPRVTDAPSQPTVPTPVVPVAPSTPEPALTEPPEPTTATAPEPTPTEPEPVPSAPEPVPTEPEPAPSKPAPSTPEPPPSTPEPAPSTPEPAPSSPKPASSTPEPAPSSPKPASSTPQPAPSMPEPAPTSADLTPSVPVSAVGDMKGLWGGTLGPNGFLLRIQSQDGARFTGSAEVMDPDGSRRYAVTGTFGEGSVRFAGQGVTFSGSAAAHAMSGTMTLEGESLSWSVTR